jgi:hypothetical protein
MARAEGYIVMPLPNPKPPGAKPVNAKPEKVKTDQPHCSECDQDMVVTLSVPVPHAPGFEDVFYECPTCHREVKRTAIPF